MGSLEYKVDIPISCNLATLKICGVKLIKCETKEKCSRFFFGLSVSIVMYTDLFLKTNPTQLFVEVDILLLTKSGVSG